VSEDRGKTNQAGAGGGDMGAARVATLISALLRWGVRVSLVLIVIGSVVGLTTGAASKESVSQLTGAEAAVSPNVPWLIHELASGHGRALIVLGLLVLIATPVLRVILSLTFFAIDRDRFYVGITASVLALLLLSFILGKAAP
jgi:uncharacterized membrane protein